MNRNVISRLVEVSLLAGIAISIVGAGPGFAQDVVTVAKPAAASKVQAGAAVPPPRQKAATQKLMRNPWESRPNWRRPNLVQAKNGATFTGRNTGSPHPFG